MSLLRRGSDHHAATAATAASPGGAPHRLWTRRAHKDGRELMRMHCFTAKHEFLVLCDVFPPHGDEARRVQAGPYVFSSRREAEEFAGEAGLMLEHLGCAIAAA
jgi:hypothetical protein